MSCIARLRTKGSTAAHSDWATGCCPNFNYRSMATCSWHLETAEPHYHQNKCWTESWTEKYRTVGDLKKKKGKRKKNVTDTAIPGINKKNTVDRLKRDYCAFIAGHIYIHTHTIFSQPPSPRSHPVFLGIVLSLSLSLSLCSSRRCWCLLFK